MPFDRERHGPQGLGRGTAWLFPPLISGFYVAVDSDQEQCQSIEVEQIRFSLARALLGKGARTRSQAAGRGCTETVSHCLSLRPARTSAAHLFVTRSLGWLERTQNAQRALATSRWAQPPVLRGWGLGRTVNKRGIGAGRAGTKVADTRGVMHADSKRQPPPGYHDDCRVLPGQQPGPGPACFAPARA